MAPLTPQKRPRRSPAPITPVKKTRVAVDFSNSDEDKDNSPILSSNESVGVTPGQRRHHMPPPLTPKKSIDGLSQFGGLQIATPRSSRSGQQPPGIQAGYAALEIDEELDMEPGNAGEPDTEDEEEEVANAINMESESELQDAMAAIREYIYPPPLRGYKNSMFQYGPEQEVMEGETPEDDDEKATDKPVRILNNFVFHLDRTKQLWGLGDVCPKLDEDENDEMESEASQGQDDAQINLGPVVDAYQGCGDTDTNATIWVETELAWYILEAPHEVYRDAYKPFLVAHTFKLILSLLIKDSPVARAEKFHSTIQEPHGIYSVILRNAGQHLGCRLGLKDFWDNIVGLRSACMNADDQDFLDTPMVSQLLGQLQHHQQPTLPKRQRPPISSGKYTHQNSVTPLIYQIGNRHFLRPLKCLGQTLEEYEEYEGTQQLVEEMIEMHEQAPCQLDLSRSDMVEGRDGADTFTSLEIDGIQYQRGDIVLVMPGEDSEVERQQRASVASACSPNCLANAFWFAEIVYFFKQKKRVSFHAHWLLHSSKSFLQETADPQEVFLINECSDCSVESIVQHADVEFLHHGKTPPMVHDPTSFFCRFLYRRKKGCFLDVASFRSTTLLPQSAHCYPCSLQAEQRLLKTPRLLHPEQLAILFHGIEYHSQDFVYIKPDMPGPFIMAQIYSATINKGKVRVLANLLQRSASDSTPFYDDRKLLMTANRIQCSAERLSGKYYAILDPQESLELDSWLKNSNHFWVAQFNTEGHSLQLQSCSQCLQNHLHDLTVRTQLIKTVPLKGLDLFSGCGGFQLGLDQNKIVTTKWSIECNPHAIRTMRENMPLDHVVIPQDINIVLAEVIKHSLDGTHNPELPGLDEVDIIYGGPPCQSFSYANSFKKDDDPRHSLSLTALSFVDLYRPSYVIFENVRGMADYSLINSEGDLVKMGMLKLWLRCLTAMDYQVHPSILEAGAYGTPQARGRLIVIAARRGCSLPSFPLPTHCFAKQPHPIHTPDGATITSPSSLFAPLAPITVEMAIGDLPCFDWSKSGPDEVFSPVFNSKTGWGHLIEYKSAPQTQYQASLHNPAGKLQQHFTRLYSHIVTARQVINTLLSDRHSSIEMKDLPQKYWDKVWEKKPLNNTTYKRITGSGFFPTSTCKVNPASRYGQVLHPNQRRVISLREYARAQGFPDQFLFYTADSDGSVNELFKQVGNAVPIPLGMALGEALMSAVVSDHIPETL